MGHYLSGPRNRPSFRMLLPLLLVLGFSGCGTVRAVRLMLPPEVQFDEHDSQTHCNFGVVYEQAGDLRRARRQYRWAIRKEGTNHVAWANLGNVYLKIGRWRSARKCYGQALQVEDSYLPARNNLAVTYLDHGRTPEEAVALLEGTVSELPVEHATEILDTLMRAYEKTGNTAKASETKTALDEARSAQQTAAKNEQQEPKAP